MTKTPRPPLDPPPRPLRIDSFICQSIRQDFTYVINISIDTSIWSDSWFLSPGKSKCTHARTHTPRMDLNALAHGTFVCVHNYISGYTVTATQPYTVTSTARHKHKCTHTHSYRSPEIAWLIDTATQTRTQPRTHTPDRHCHTQPHT